MRWHLRRNVELASPRCMNESQNRPQMKWIYRRSPTYNGWLTIYFMMVQKQYAFKRNCTSNFEFWSFPQLVTSSTIVTCEAGQCAPPSQAWDHQGKWLILHSVLSCHHFCRCDIVLFSYPIISTKCPSMFPASGERKKAITLEIKLKIIAQQ